MKRYAIVKDGRIENIALWDGVHSYDPGPGFTMVEIPDDQPGIGVGWTYDNDGFHEPTLP